MTRDNINIAEKRVVLFGCSTKELKRISRTIQQKIDYIVDENPALWNTLFTDIKIYSPYILAHEEYKDNIMVFMVSKTSGLLQSNRAFAIWVLPIYILLHFSIRVSLILIF